MTITHPPGTLSQIRAALNKCAGLVPHAVFPSPQRVASDRSAFYVSVKVGKQQASRGPLKGVTAPISAQVQLQRWAEVGTSRDPVEGFTVADSAPESVEVFLDRVVRAVDGFWGLSEPHP